MEALLVVIGLATFTLVVGLGLFYGAVIAAESKGARYRYNQLLIKIAIGCLNRVEFKSQTNDNMLRVVRNEANCLKGCI